PVFVVSNVACSGWEGTATFDGRWDSVRRLSAKWEVKATLIEKGYLPNSAGFQYDTTAKLTYTSYGSITNAIECIRKGSHTLSPVTFRPLGFAPPESAAYRQAKILLSRPALDGGTYCTGATNGEFEFNLPTFPGWASSHRDTASMLFPVETSGTVIKGERPQNKNNVVGTWTWEFRAIP
ncbi:MAG: hypothetical protein ABR517_12900, partial [Thermoanaerobaculia bacterium]